MPHTVYKQIVALSHKQQDKLRWEIYQAGVHQLVDPRLRVGFYFYGRAFQNYACVERYKADTQTLDVRVYIGSLGSSYVEYDWNATHFLHGFRDSEYLACCLRDDYEPGTPSPTAHDHCPAP